MAGRGRREHDDDGGHLIPAPEQDVRDAISAWRLAFDAGDASAADLLDPDAVLMAPGRAPVRGRDACAASLSPSLGIRSNFRVAQAVVYGDWAHAWCDVTRSIPAAGSDPEVKVEGHTLTLLRKGEAGKWLIAREAMLLAPAR